MTTAYDAIQIASARYESTAATMKTSAAVCLEDARAMHEKGNDAAALMWAAKSLAYSVGVFHEDYKKVKSAI